MDVTTAAAASEPTGFAARVIAVMEALGGPGAGLIIALENLFPPLPSEVVLPLAGYTASRGTMTLWGAVLWTTLGSLVGALVLYYVGAWLGRDRTRAIAVRIPLVKVADIDRTEAWFAEHGVKAVFFGRMIPMFRSFISLPAGIERMPLTTFVLFTTLGSLIWNSAFVLAGYTLGAKWYIVERYAGFFSKAVLAAVVLAVVYFVAVRLIRRRSNRQQGHDRQGYDQQGHDGTDSDDTPTQELGATTAVLDAPTVEFRRIR
ncbi:DedA family protein [Haloactinomyces albus]|uniref:Membrane protein DedA with SNARE-associated domain n=1 Tax=Haloactinomyces albus TaxID=1352928 RepID=A0AAE3ZD62_9ACTN|nr:DedA family protein [Haloactinomyces albus]MDR7301670.1 membrane protein DedA with SNARE-associated domain [Haloactinomyces albus]